MISTTPWPDLPYKIPVKGSQGEDYGAITILKLGRAAPRSLQSAFSALVDKLENHLPSGSYENVTGYDHNGRYYFVLKIDPFEGDDVPKIYLGRTFSTLRDVVREHGIKDIIARIDAPFCVGEFGLDTTGSASEPVEAPIFFNVGDSEYIVQVTSLDATMTEAQKRWTIPITFTTEIKIGELSSLDPNADFKGLQWDLTREDYEYHFKVEPREPSRQHDHLTNSGAEKALYAWVPFLLGAPEDEDNSYAQTFEIISVELFGSAVVANGRFWWNKVGDVAGIDSTPVNGHSLIKATGTNIVAVS